MLRSMAGATALVSVLSTVHTTSIPSRAAYPEAWWNHTSSNHTHTVIDLPAYETDDCDGSSSSNIPIPRSTDVAYGNPVASGSPIASSGPIASGSPNTSNSSSGSSCVHGPGDRGCWNGVHNIDTDMDLAWPDTRKTVSYDFEVTNITMSPDGVPRGMMVVNGQYPGPAIVADWGDTIEVTVTNKLQVNGTGIHWHGVRLLNANNMDGSPGVTECPIPPGGKKTYKFQATQYGTSWWHSHYSVQYGDGLLGPLIINGPATMNYDIDLGMMPITDWFYGSSFTLNSVALHARGPPTADTMLVNGSMVSTSGGAYGSTHLTPGKTHRLRLANTGINNWAHVSLDNHEFTVIAADFVPIVPYKTKSLVMAVGQRYDVVIEANQPVANYWLRVGTGGGTCDGPNLNAANIRSIFRYDGADQEANADSVDEFVLPTGCYDESGLVPHVSTQVPAETPEEMTLNFTTTGAVPGLVQWLINGSPMQVDLGNPTLYQLQEGNSTFKGSENVFMVGEAAKFQYWVIQEGADIPAKLPHPIHLHGHDFYILDSAANATWNGDVSRLKLANPPRRDTATLPESGYLVLAFESDNPGAWLMHCHIPFHVAAGFALQFVERSEDINGTALGGDGVMQEECQNWGTFSKQMYPNGYEEGDSLL